MKTKTVKAPPAPKPKWIRVLAAPGLLLPIPKRTGVAVNCSDRYFPTEGEGVKVKRAHPFVVRRLKSGDLVVAKATGGSK